MTIKEKIRKIKEIELTIEKVREDLGPTQQAYFAAREKARAVRKKMAKLKNYSEKTGYEAWKICQAEHEAFRRHNIVCQKISQLLKEQRIIEEELENKQI